MAFAPVQLFSTPIEDYAGYWVKFYEQGTTTPLSMATDSTGGTLLAKAEVSSSGAVPVGFLKTAGDALLNPFVNGDYDCWLFPTSTEADANDTTNAIQIADNLNADPDVSSDLLRADLASTTAGKGASLVSFESGETVQDLAETAISTTKGFHLVKRPLVAGETRVVNHEYPPGDLRRHGDLTVDLGAAVNNAILDGHRTLYVPAGSWIQATQIVLGGNNIIIYSDVGYNPFGFSSATITKTGNFPHVDADAQFNSYGIKYDGTGVIGSSSGIILHKKCEFFGAIYNQPGDGLVLSAASVGDNLNACQIGGDFSLNGGHGVVIEDTRVTGSNVIDINVIYSPRIIAIGNTQNGLELRGGLFYRFPNVQSDSNGGHGVHFNAINNINNGEFNIYAESNAVEQVEVTDTGGLFSDNVFYNGRGFNGADIFPDQDNVFVTGNAFAVDSALSTPNTALVLRNSSATAGTTRGARLAWEISGGARAYMEAWGNGRIKIAGFGTGQGILIGDGAWDSDPISMGNYVLWVDATGDLRIKNGYPTSDTDGTVVGTQT